MIVILSDSKKESVGTRLYQACKERGAEVTLISVSERNVKPCYGCGGCTNKSFGKCVFRDDMDEILPVLIHAEPLVLCFPLTWGGFSFDVKKVMDKTLLLGNPFYKVKENELVKGWKGEMKHLIAIGVKDVASEDEKVAFQRMVSEIAKIMDITGKSHLVHEEAGEKAINYLVKEVMEV